MNAEDKLEVLDMLKQAPLSNIQRAEIEQVFITRKECEDTTEGLAAKLNRDFADLKVIKFQLRLILGILSAVGVAVLGLVVAQFWGG